ncbi:MAG: hypothetical protein BWY00_01625 [Firmicutes bacterium ADurb.Bin153]|nr:MAG: hypothetical protein BWY00_01625 [Firmicutes bacterium ADurb.Bin153]
MRRPRSLFILFITMAMFIFMTTSTLASEISLAKNVDPTSPNIYRVGDTIHYIVTVGNPEHNTLTNTLKTITDIMPDGSTEILATDVVQEPGDSDSYDVYYVVDENDLQNISGVWRVFNEVEIDGTDSEGSIVKATTSKGSVVIKPSIEIEKYVNGEEADDAPGPGVLVGDDVVFEFTVTNTGDCTLTNVSVDDDILGHIGTIASLASGASQTLSRTVSATEGQHANTATVTGTPPVGDVVTADDPGHYFGENPSYRIDKTVEETEITAPCTLHYTVVLTNTGNIDLTGVTLDDSLVEDVGSAVESLSADGVLNVGEHWTWTYTYSVSQAEVNLGDPIDNTATGDCDQLDEVSDSCRVPIIQNPSIDLEKLVNGDDADVPTGPTVAAGSTVTFTFIVTNNGNVTLTNVSVDDNVLGHIGTIATLEVGASQTMTSTATAIAGQYENMGTVTGTPPTGEDVTDEDPGHYYGTANFEGLTPGYWKNHPRSWVGFNTTDLVGDVFDIPDELSELADDTLMQALNYGGGRDVIGAARNLLRIAVAAVLNAAHPNINYPMAMSDIIEDVNEALASLNRTVMGRLQATLDRYNNLEGDINN